MASAASNVDSPKPSTLCFPEWLSLLEERQGKRKVPPLLRHEPARARISITRAVPIARRDDCGLHRDFNAAEARRTFIHSAARCARR
jgi:hypothetical protein